MEGDARAAGGARPTPGDIAWLVRLLLRPAAGAKDRYAAAAGRVEAALEKLDAVSAPAAVSAIADEAERKARVLFGVAHARLCSSLGQGMETALKLSGLKPGDEVILPPTAALASVLYPLSIGARIAFTDPDPEAIESRVAPRTRTIIVVHAGGFPADVDPVMRIAALHNLTVIEVAEGGMGARYKGKYLGTIGHFGCVSASVVDGAHPLGESSLLLSNAELGRAEEGVLYDRFGQLQVPDGESPTAAHAMGCLLDLKQWKTASAARRRAAQVLCRRFSREPAILPPFQESAGTTASWSRYPLLTDPSGAGGDARDLGRRIEERGVVGISYPAPLYRSRLLEELGYDAAEEARECPVTEELLGRRLLYLPLAGLTGEQVETLASVVLAGVAGMRGGAPPG